jgi:hypothetical protein
MTDPDNDLDHLDRDELLAVARKLRQAIRDHRDSSGHDLCWHWPEMWALLPDTPPEGQQVPEWAQFMRGCIRYRTSLDKELADAPRTDKEFDG